MPFRIVGALAIILGGGIILLAFSDLSLHKDIAAIMSTQDARWRLPVTPDEFLARSTLLAGAGAVCGVLTGVAGVGMVFRQRWGLYVAVFAALLMAGFPWLTGVLASSRYAFDGPDLPELFIASVIGLVASLAFMLRPKRDVDA